MLLKKSLPWSLLLLAGSLSIGSSLAQEFEPKSTPILSNNAVNLDLTAVNSTLSSKNKNPVVIQVGGHLANGSVTGGSPVTVSPSQLVTPSQFLAVFQVLSGNQTLLLSGGGAAGGGSINLNSKYVQNIQGLVVPNGLTVNAIGYNQATPLNITGNVNLLGSLYSLQTSPSITSVLNLGNLFVGAGAVLSGRLPNGVNLPGLYSSGGMQLNVAGVVQNQGLIETPGTLNIVAGGNITNQSTSSIQAFISAQNVLIASGTGNILNSGLIQASRSLNFNTINPETNLTINNTAGILRALGVVNSFTGLIESRSINIREGANPESANVKILGGTIEAPNGINILGKDIDVHVDRIDGEISCIGSTAHLSVNSGNLVLGDQILSGDPTYYNSSGDITISSLTTVGGDLAIVASGEILLAGDSTIQTTAANNSIFLGSGLNFSVTPSDSSVSSFPSNDPGDTSNTLTLDGTTNPGKNINPSGFKLDLITSGAGTITAVASGAINFGSGSITSDSGNILVIGASGVALTGAAQATTGSVSIASASADNLLGIQITKGTTSNLPSVGTLTSAPIVVGSVTASGGITLQNSDSTINTGTLITSNLAGNAGPILVTSGTNGSVSTGAIQANVTGTATSNGVQLSAGIIHVLGGINTDAGVSGKAGPITLISGAIDGSISIDGNISSIGSTKGSIDLTEDSQTPFIFNTLTAGANTIQGTVTGGNIFIQNKGTGPVLFDSSAATAVSGILIDVTAGKAGTAHGTITGTGNGTDGAAFVRGALQATQVNLTANADSKTSGLIGEGNSQVVLNTKTIQFTAETSLDNCGDVYLTNIGTPDVSLCTTTGAGLGRDLYFTGNGNITVSKALTSINNGTISLVTSTGSIDGLVPGPFPFVTNNRITSKTGSVIFRTNNGSINVVTTAGAISAFSGEGHVHITNNVKTQITGLNGALTTGSPQSVDYHLTNTSGDILLNSGITAGDIDLESTGPGNKFTLGPGAGQLLAGHRVSFRTNGGGIDSTGGSLDILAANFAVLQLSEEANIGHVDLTGMPGAYVSIVLTTTTFSSATIELRGFSSENATITTDGGNVTLISPRSIQHVGNITTSASSGDGGNITIHRGSGFGADTLSLSALGSGGTASGGVIDLVGVDRVTGDINNSSTGTGTAGTITMTQVSKLQPLTINTFALENNVTGKIVSSGAVVISATGVVLGGAGDAIVAREIGINAGTGSITAKTAGLGGLSAPTMALNSTTGTGSISGAIPITITTPGTTTLGSSASGAGADTYLNVTAGDLNVGNVVVGTVSASGITSGGNILVTVQGNDLQIGKSSSINSESGTIQIAGGSVTIDGVLGNANTILSVSSTAGNISGSGVLHASELIINAPGGNVGAASPLSTATGILSFNAKGSVNLFNTGDVTTGSSIGESIALASTGKINAAANMSASGAIFLTAGEINTATGVSLTGSSVTINGNNGVPLVLGNSGTITATSGNIEISSASEQSLIVGTPGKTGSIIAGSGTIALTATGIAFSTNSIDFVGNQTFTGDTVLNASGFSQSVTVESTANVIGNDLLSVNSSQVNLFGSISGNPLIFNSQGGGTIANSNPAVSLDLKNIGNINFVGKSLTILAAGNIINTGPVLSIDLSGGFFPNTQSQLSSGSLTVIAGFNFSGGPISPALPPDSGTFQLTTPNAGKSIDLSKVSITSSHSTAGGNVLAVATGSIKLSSINLSAGTSDGTAGSLAVFGNGVTLAGAINTSAFNSGSVSINSGIPASSGTITIQNGVLSEGTFTTPTPAGSIVLGPINAGNENVSLITGGAGTLTQSKGGISTSGVLAVSSGSKGFSLKTAAGGLQLNTNPSSTSANVTITSSVLTSLLNSNIGGNLKIVSIAGILVASGQTITSGGSIVLTNQNISSNLQLENGMSLLAAKGITLSSPGYISMGTGNINSGLDFSAKSSAGYLQVSGTAITAPKTITLYGNTGVTIDNAAVISALGGMSRV